MDDDDPNPTSVSPSAASGAGSTRNKKHKYMKPRIGNSFQAKVEPFDQNLAKAVIQTRTEEKRKGLCGYTTPSYNNCSIGNASGNGNDNGNNNGGGDNIISGDCNILNGGLFARQSNTFGQGHYGSMTGTTGNGNGGGKRKRAGRPPKNSKGNSKGENEERESCDCTIAN